MEDIDLLNATKDIPLFSLNGMKIKAKVVDIYDGDSLTIVIPLFNKLYSFKTRLIGIDTLEIKAPDYVNEDIKGLYKEKACKAKNFVLSNIIGEKIDETKKYTKKEVCDLLNKNKKLVTIECLNNDKYGRTLIKLYTDDKKCINDMLIENNLAYSYDGDTKDKTIF